MRHSNPLKTLWSLDPGLIFLSHGSFGACPKVVLETQDHFRDRMERDPVAFFARDLEPLLDEACRPLARFINAPVDDLTFIENTTSGVNAVLRSMSFRNGEEILTTNHTYNACMNALNYVAARQGIHVVVAELPSSIQSPDEILDSVLSCCTAKTRLALIDHVTSPSAMIIPIEAMVEQLRHRGIESLIDGAHAPGMVPIDLQAMRPTYYVANCHKWLCAPKGAAFLYVEPGKQDQVRPLTISHGANAPARTDRSRFHLEFDWTGTLDISSYLSVPFALEYLPSLVSGGWPNVYAQNHQKAIRARRVLCEVLETPPECPETMLGSMANLRIPRIPRHANGLPWSYAEIHDYLYDHYRIQVTIHDFPHPGQTCVRLSAMLYNSDEEYDCLAQALRKMAKQ